jgi:hypothetical protein
MLIHESKHLIRACSGSYHIAHARRRGMGAHGKHHAAIKASQAHRADGQDSHRCMSEFSLPFTENMIEQDDQQWRSEY